MAGFNLKLTKSFSKLHNKNEICFYGREIAQNIVDLYIRWQIISLCQTKTRKLTKQQTRLSLSSKQGRIHDRSIPSSSPTSSHASTALNLFSIKQKINYHIVHREEKQHDFIMATTRSPQSFTEISWRVRDLAKSFTDKKKSTNLNHSVTKEVKGLIQDQCCSLMLPVDCSGQERHHLSHSRQI